MRGSFGAVLATRARRRTAALGASAPLARAAPPVLVRPAGAAPVTGTAEAILTSRPEAERTILEQARTQLSMLLVGALHWRSGGPD